VLGLRVGLGLLTRTNFEEAGSAGLLLAICNIHHNIAFTSLSIPSFVHDLGFRVFTHLKPPHHQQAQGRVLNQVLTEHEVLIAASERFIRSPCCSALYAGESKSSDGKSGVPGGVNSLYSSRFHTLNLVFFALRHVFLAMKMEHTPPDSSHNIILWS
jgi:hypothetical protein